LAGAPPRHRWWSSYRSLRPPSWILEVVRLRAERGGKWKRKVGRVGEGKGEEGMG